MRALTSAIASCEARISAFVCIAVLQNISVKLLDALSYFSVNL